MIYNLIFDCTPPTTQLIDLTTVTSPKVKALLTQAITNGSFEIQDDSNIVMSYISKNVGNLPKYPCCVENEITIWTEL